MLSVATTEEVQMTESLLKVGCQKRQYNKAVGLKIGHERSITLSKIIDTNNNVAVKLCVLCLRDWRIAVSW